MEIITRLIICGLIIFIGGFSIGMLIGLFIGERKEHKKQKKAKIIQTMEFIRKNAEETWGKRKK